VRPCKPLWDTFIPALVWKHPLTFLESQTGAHGFANFSVSVHLSVQVFCEEMMLSR
jgi:hypothetical protein